MYTWIQRRHTQPSSTLLGLLLAVGIVWIGALHHSPTAHGAVHEDAHEEDHHCVVEIFADGLVAEVAALHVVVATKVITAEFPELSQVWLEKTEHLHPPGRAPPLG